jgi:hypothetical protein
MPTPDGMYTPETDGAMFRSRDEMENLYFAVFDAVVRARGLGELSGGAQDLDELLGDQKDEVLALVKALMVQWGTTAENGNLDELHKRAEEGVHVSSGFGALTQRPFVNITAEGQFRPEQARQLALEILDAATVAESDGMMLRFVREKLEREDLGEQMMHTMREFREEFRAQDMAAAPEELRDVAEVRRGVRAIS